MYLLHTYIIEHLITVNAVALSLQILTISWTSRNRQYAHSIVISGMVGQAYTFQPIEELCGGAGGNNWLAHGEHQINRVTSTS